MACSTDIEGVLVREPTSGGASCINLKKDTTAASDCCEDDPTNFEQPVTTKLMNLHCMLVMS